MNAWLWTAAERLEQAAASRAEQLVKRMRCMTHNSVYCTNNWYIYPAWIRRRTGFRAVKKVRELFGELLEE